MAYGLCVHNNAFHLMVFLGSKGIGRSLEQIGWLASIDPSERKGHYQNFPSSINDSLRARSTIHTVF